MPVDWAAITSGASTRTNYQLMPGDRVFIAADPVRMVAQSIGNIVGPAQEVAGYLSLQSTVIRAFQALGRSSSGYIIPDSLLNQ